MKARDPRAAPTPTTLTPATPSPVISTRVWSPL